ncbi:MAG: CcmD family protein [Bacteroidota bacterium]|nr:CcmD family protein [Bacteroidota bacterium]MDP3144146.1 CcmD family protein [Bacteroidota bacterium]MDP3558251.1 CcmD family protein [Bacteroidota bacterium]
MIKKILSLVLLLSALATSAQETTSSPQMADAFRSEGKIYVVIAVIAIIFIALVAFLITIERNVKKLEKQINKD